MSIFSVGLCAVGMMIIFANYSAILESNFLRGIGKISFEIFLMHQAVMRQLPPNLTGVVLFIIITIVGSMCLCFLIGQAKRAVKR